MRLGFESLSFVLASRNAWYSACDASEPPGPKGTIVKVGMERKGIKDILYFNITRDKIPIYSVDAAYMITPEIGYIKVSRFAATTTEELRKGISELKGQGMRDLVLDLQDNGGGLLRSAIEMGDEFLLN
jgi:carboxyl-terminal processing protease